MKILYSTTFLILHAGICMAVLNKGSPSSPNEASEADAVAQTAGYQYNGPLQQQYLPTSLQQGYQYVVPVAHNQPNVAYDASPIYQHTTATQAVAVDATAGLPNKLPANTESDTYFVAKDEQKTSTVNINPGYAPPEYHSGNYYVPRQNEQEQQQHLVPQQQATNGASNRPHVSSIQDHEYFVERRPDQRGSNGESLNTFPSGYTNNLVTSNRVPQYTATQEHSNGYVYPHAENCASTHTNLQTDNNFQIASPAAQTQPDFNAYQNVRPLYQPANQEQLTTGSIDQGNTQNHPQAITSSLANSQTNNDSPVKPQVVQILTNFVTHQNERPSYHSVGSAHIPAEHQGHENVQTFSQATSSGLSFSQPGAELAHHGYNYRYQQPTFNPANQGTSHTNEFEPQAQQSNNFNENKYVPQAAPTSAASVIYTPSQTHPATHYLSPLHTQVIASIPYRAHPGRTPSAATVSNYAVTNKGLGHYSYTQSSPVALSTNDELLTGEQHQQLVKPSTGGRNYLQMQSQSYELPTYSSSMHTELPVATDYAKQRIQGSQILTHYAAPSNSNLPPSGFVVPQGHYRVATTESVATPSNTYLPPSDEAKPTYF